MTAPDLSEIRSDAELIVASLRTTKKQALRVPIYRDSVRMARLFVRRARVAGFRGMIAP